MNAKPNVQQTILLLRKLLTEKRFAQAETIARHLQNSYPRRADTNDAFGCVLAAMHDNAQAIGYCRRAVEIEPRNPIYLLNCGRILLEMSHITEAEPLLQRALSLDPKLYLAAWTLGSFYVRIGRGDRALGYYEKAMSSAPPAMCPAIRYEISNCLVSLGRAAEAESELRKNLMPGPLHAKSVAALADLGKHTVGTPEFSMVETELQRRDLTLDDRSSLLLHKGIMLENSGRFAEAFETFRTAKQILRIVPDIAAFRREVDTRIDVFTAETIRRLADAYGHSSRRHVFIVGMPRSGTTLTEQIIEAHSQAGGAGELMVMQMLSKAMRSGGNLSDIEAVLEADGGENIRRGIQFYVSLMDYLAPGKNLIADKMPHNFTLIGEISILFPHAKIVHCIRNPADNFLSAFQNQMNQGHSYSYAADSYAEYYAEYLRLMRHWYKVLPGRIFTMEYEKLTANPSNVIAELLQYLGLEWEDGCLNFHQNKSTVLTFSRLQVRSAINTGSVGRWKNYERETEGLTRRLADEPPLECED